MNIEFADVLEDSPHVGRAIAEMGLTPEKLLFVDDDPHYVKEAIGLGLNGILMVRSGEPADVDVEWVRDLEEIEAFLKSE